MSNIFKLRGYELYQIPDPYTHEYHVLMVSVAARRIENLLPNKVYVCLPDDPELLHEVVGEVQTNDCNAQPTNIEHPIEWEQALTPGKLYVTLEPDYAGFTYPYRAEMI